MSDNNTNLNEELEQQSEQVQQPFGGQMNGRPPMPPHGGQHQFGGQHPQAAEDNTDTTEV